EVVAMEQVTACISAPSDDDVHLFAVFDSDRVLPSTLVSQRWSAVPAQNLKGGEMGMDGMQHRPPEEPTIQEPPYFDVAEPRGGVDSVGMERVIVDPPSDARWNTDRWLAAEDERPRPRRLQR